MTASAAPAPPFTTSPECTTHHFACACRERAFAELRGAAYDIVQNHVWEIMHDGSQYEDVAPAIIRLRNALEATR